MKKEIKPKIDKDQLSNPKVLSNEVRNLIKKEESVAHREILKKLLEQIGSSSILGNEIHNQIHC